MICRIFHFEIMSLATSASRQFNQEAGHGAEARRESSRRYRRHDGDRLGQRDFYSMSDCQDGLSNMVEELQPEWHEVFVREGTIVRSPNRNLTPSGALEPGQQKGGESRHDIEISGVRRRSAPPTRCNQTSHPFLKGRKIMMMNRRAFSASLVTGAAASLISARGIAANSTAAKASNVVLVHGLFADGSCWSEVIARLHAAGLNATAVQNPLTTLPEAVDRPSGCWRSRMARRCLWVIPSPA
jgi:hypothetical protein